MQVNSVVPGPVMTDRRRSFLKKWALSHGLTLEQATQRFPEDAGIARYGEPEELADLRPATHTRCASIAARPLASRTPWCCALK